MADAFKMAEHRHPGIAFDARNQALAATRHDHINAALKARQHQADGITAAHGHALDRGSGQAGTGKTLLALAAGLQLVAEEKRYRKIMVSRPIMPLGRDIGYLPDRADHYRSNSHRNGDAGPDFQIPSLHTTSFLA